MQPQSRRIQLGTGLSYHVLEWGAGDPALDHTVLLLHGFMDIAWSWCTTVAAGLAGRFHLVAPDFRGHGDSDRVGAGGYYHFMDYIADVEALAAQVAGGRLSVVGHSMGGSVASYFTGAYPARVHRLALLEGLGPPELPGEVPDRVVGWLAGWKKARERAPRGYPDLAAAAAQLRKNDALVDEATALDLAEHGTTRGDDGLLRFKHDPLHLTMGPYPYRTDVAREFWRRIRCPVLLVSGGASTFRHVGAEDAARRAAFSDLREAVLPGAGHMMQRHRPAELAALLADFLAG